MALKYGYRADQRVVNIVLRQRFHSTTARLDTNTSTEGGYYGGMADATRLTIQKNGRTTYNVHAEGNSPLTEDERDIELSDPTQPDDRSARTLVSRKRLLRGSTTVNRTIFTDVGAVWAPASKARADAPIAATATAEQRLFIISSLSPPAQGAPALFAITW